MRPARHAGALLAAALLAAAGVAQANNDGRQTNRFVNGCTTGTSCHAPNAGATVSLSGPMTLAPGARGAYTLTVASSLAGFASAGLDVSLAGTAGGSLATVSPGTQVRNGDITHTGAIARAGANVQVQFTLVAPPTAGTVTIQAVGNAVNGDTRNTGDSSARTTLAVAVTTGAAPDASVTPDGSVAPDASVTPDAARADGATEFEQYDPSASMAYGGCAASPRGGAGAWWLAGAAAVALAARRRRRTCAGR